MYYHYFPVFLLCCICCDAANILGIFPVPSWSHQLPFQAIMKELARRGHQVTVISPSPLKVPMANYTDIDISFSYQHSHTHWDFANQNLFGRDFVQEISSYFEILVDEQLASKPVQEFIKSNKKFDMMIYEMHAFPAYYGMLHKVGSPPLVGVFSLGAYPHDMLAMGNPDNPAYMPDWPNPLSYHMTFTERVYNTWFKLWDIYHWYWQVLPTQEIIMRKFFGSAPPPLVETERNRSLMIISNHWCLDYPRPLLPNVIQVTGLHLQHTRTPLPQKIQHFLDEAENGVIYFSLGSNVRSDKLPKKTLSFIVEAFSELPQRIIWKWESDSLPGQPSNVMVEKWLPQEDVLAHPNIQAFIFQGGLQSLQEAAYNGVPVLTIPFFSDQLYNARKVEHAGIGIVLEIGDLTKATFLTALKKVLQDPRYRNAMQQVSALFKEEASMSLDRTIWWIEYILRHKGAPHLRSAALDLTWYQYLLLDVIGAIIIGLTLIVVILYGVLKTLISFLRTRIGDTKNCHRYKNMGDEPYKIWNKITKEHSN